jgi:hypothetical protein
MASSVGTIAPFSQLILSQNRFWNYGSGVVFQAESCASNSLGGSDLRGGFSMWRPRTWFSTFGEIAEQIIFKPRIGTAFNSTRQSFAEGRPKNQDADSQC